MSQNSSYLCIVERNKILPQTQKREFKNYNSINNLKFKKGKELWQRLQL